MRREGARRQKNDRKTVLYAYPLHRGSFLQDTLHQQVLVTNKDRLLQRTYFFRSLLGQLARMPLPALKLAVLPLTVLWLTLMPAPPFPLAVLPLTVQSTQM